MGTVKLRQRFDHEALHCTYDILEATEELLSSVRRTSLGEKLVVEEHLRVLWEQANPPERVIIAAIVNALELPGHP